MRYYSPAEVVELLGVPESSLRRIARQFQAHLSPQHKRKRRYSERDVSTIRLIREMLSNGRTIEQVQTELEKVIDLQPEETEETALAPIDRRLSQIAADLEQLRQDRQADREKLAQLEEEILQLRRPWWKKIIPPRSRTE